MTTMSKKISHTGPVEISEHLLTMVSGGKKEEEPVKPPEGASASADYSYNNTLYGHFNYTVPVSPNVDVTFKVSGDTNRGATAGYATVTYTWR